MACRCEHCDEFHPRAHDLCEFCEEHCPHMSEPQGNFVEGFLGIQRWHAHRAKSYLDDMAVDGSVHAGTLMRHGMDGVLRDLRLLKESRELDRGFLRSLDRTQ